ncbi:hypothetical protein [Micromonospora sp. NPDC023814]|uniref:hypothetical protein n=1 Tax=Micromonospora sp. NPDC023814 TaxID=3154596 RepID=UPI0033C7AE04
MTSLCVADHCGIRHQHQPDCPNPQTCPGCLPRPAADGLRLCEVDMRRLAEDARTAAVLYEDLALTLIRRGRGGERVAGSSTGAPVPDDEVMEARQAIRATLVSLVRIIADERGLQTPADEVSALGAYVAHHAVWLAAHPAADEHAKDLRDIAGDGRNWRMAYPAKANRTYAGRCTFVDGETGVECGTEVFARPGELTARCEVCGEDYDIAVRQDEMRAALLDAVARPVEIASITLRLGTPVAYSTIAAYAQQGRIEPRGQDGRGRVLYRVGDVVQTRLEAKGPRRVREHPRGAVNL